MITEPEADGYGIQRPEASTATNEDARSSTGSFHSRTPKVEDYAVQPGDQPAPGIFRHFWKPPTEWGEPERVYTTAYRNAAVEVLHFENADGYVKRFRVPIHRYDDPREEK